MAPIRKAKKLSGDAIFPKINMSRTTGIQKAKPKQLTESSRDRFFGFPQTSYHLEAPVSRQEYPDHYVLFQMTTPEKHRISRGRELVEQAKLKSTDIDAQLSIFALTTLDITSTTQAFRAPYQLSDIIASGSDTAAKHMQEVIFEDSAQQAEFDKLYEAVAALDQLLSMTISKGTKREVLSSYSVELGTKVETVQTAIIAYLQWERQQIAEDAWEIAHREVLREIRARGRTQPHESAAIVAQQNEEVARRNAEAQDEVSMLLDAVRSKNGVNALTDFNATMDGMELDEEM